MVGRLKDILSYLILLVQCALVCANNIYTIIQIEVHHHYVSLFHSFCELV